MLTTKTYKGSEYHYNSETKRYIREEDGSMIPAEVCLCFAREPTECCCGCTSWENYKYDED